MPPSPRDILILQSIPGVGPLRLRALLGRFSGMEEIRRASLHQLAGAEGVDRKTGEAIVAFFRGMRLDEACRSADEQLLRLGRGGNRGVTLWDPEYPSLLRSIYDPPLILYSRGIFATAGNPAVAVVGTRTPSSYGLLSAERFAEELAAAGITVVSGLARGIDTASHHAALRAGGTTVAVIGSGLDRIYPSENSSLARRIAGSGAVLSEYPLGTRPDAVNFPRRNRIISGLTLATVIIETGTAGGAMITAGTALDQNREVFALPAAIKRGRRSGANALIRDGRALLVEGVDEILSELAPLLPAHLRGALPPPPPPIELSLFERRLLDVLGDEPMHLDAIAACADLAAGDTLVHLLTLELKGAIRQMAGKQFVRTGGA